ncbi:MAG: YigZ family protein [Bacteroidales bacterium]|nr:YigZ family protein [Bacteroidales bacterium]
MEDIYKTIKENSEGFFKDRGSKFIGLAFPVFSETEIKDIQKNLRNQYYDARHHCFAWRLGADKLHYRVNDDGEPSNSAGMPIFGQIQSFDLTNILIVVVRYFGGTKLGVPGLINAYRTAASEAIRNGEIIEKTVNNITKIHFEYLAMNDVMTVLKEEQLEQFEQCFELQCSINVKLRLSEAQRITERLEKIDSVKIEILRTE